MLYVEDNPDDVLLIREFLGRRGGFHVSHAPRFADAQSTLTSGGCDVVLLDLSLPDSNGIKTVAGAVEANADLPLVVLTGRDDRELAAQAVHTGAQDFLVKDGLDGALLERTLRHAVERQRLLRELRDAHASAWHRATHDGLTGLANRELYYDMLGRSLARSRRAETKLAVLFVDLDNFKGVNDAHGHLAGDELLKAASELLVTTVRSSDEVARLAGDEFAVTLPDVRRKGDAARVAKSLVRGIGALASRRRGIDVSASVGIAVFPQDGEDEMSLLQHADEAMYAAKQAGGNDYRFYQGTGEAEETSKVGLEEELREAVAESQLVLHYQPQLDLATNRLRGVEALLRWRHPRLGMLLPAQFMPLAEKTGLNVDVGRWVLKECCGQVEHWRAQGIEMGKLAMNLSASDFRDRDIASEVEEVFQRSNVPPSAFEIELTETGFAEIGMGSLSNLRDLRSLGVAISIDGFGSGVSPFAVLRRLPIDGLKIDCSFLLGETEMETETEKETEARIVEAILGLADSLGLSIVAERVETERQVAFLKERNCRVIQGNFITAPMSDRELLRWCTRRAR